MTTDELLVTLLLVLPMAGFLLTALVGRRLYTRAWIIAVPAIVVTWLIGMFIVYQALFAHAYGEEGLHFTLGSWITAGTFDVSFNFAVDNLTAYAKSQGTGRPNTSRTVAISMNGNTTPALSRARAQLEGGGFEVVAFHANGAGGRALEDYVASGRPAGVLDYTTTELGARTVGGLMDAGPARMEAAGTLGIPQVLVPGCIDFITCGPWEETEVEFPGRTMFRHNPELTLVRLNRDELAELGTVFAKKANAAIGFTSILVPSRGFSVPDSEGGPFWDPAADRAFVDALTASLSRDVSLRVVDAHVNDTAFADEAVAELLRLMSRLPEPSQTLASAGERERA